MINVTKIYLPDKKKYKKYIDDIYETGWITNNGPNVQELEKRLQNYLGVKNILLVSNGTIALDIAYRILNINGSAITTPFSFVATTSSLVSNKIRPLYVDINKETLNIDTKRIQEKIQKDTSAIVPVHVFGNACEIDEIDEIAKKNNLKVIYDAAHAFGVQYKGKSVLNYGDISTLSFHATKLFHTIEGGALVINDDTLMQKARSLINFGIDKNGSISELGTNAKMNEFEAAMGLCVLDEIENINSSRKNIYNIYVDNLHNIIQQQQNKDSTKNYSYFPILLHNEEQLLSLQKKLNQEKIYPRRYFHPSLDTLNYTKTKTICNTSRDISKRILCIPIYPHLDILDQNKIIKIIKDEI